MTGLHIWYDCCQLSTVVDNGGDVAGQSCTVAHPCEQASQTGLHGDRATGDTGTVGGMQGAAGHNGSYLQLAPLKTDFGQATKVLTAVRTDQQAAYLDMYIGVYMMIKCCCIMWASQFAMISGLTEGPDGHSISAS